MVKGSGVDEWPCMKLVWVFKYILVHVYIGVPIKLFFVRKPGEGGGESKQIFREYGFKKTSKITDDPLSRKHDIFCIAHLVSRQGPEFQGGSLQRLAIRQRV